MPHTGTLTPDQRAIVEAASDQGQSVFVHGPAGTGKTTALQQRLTALLAAGIPSYSVLTLLPDPGSAEGYHAALGEAQLGPYSDPHLTTLAGLAREVVTLLWPLVARPAGFAAPHKPPVLLSYDLAQVQMRRVIAPMLAKGAFQGLRMRPQQVLSQLLDNLNRAALNGLTLDEMEERLVRTWNGHASHIRYFRQAADAARRFRQSCLEANLLDLSLVIDVFHRHIVHDSTLSQYLAERFRHLLVDNLEEMPPVGIQFLQGMLPGADSAVLIYDEGGGYRRYLAADPQSGWALRKDCDRTLAMPRSLVSGACMEALARLVQRRLGGPAGLTYSGAAEAVTQVIKPRYRQEMIREVVSLAESLIPSATSSDQIAMVAPYLDGALLHSLTTGLTNANIPFRLLRRRSSLRDEPLVRAWLTLAALAHPEWTVAPSAYEVAEALALAVGQLDWPRARLAARRLYDNSTHGLRPTDNLTDTDKARLGMPVVERIGELQGWLDRSVGTQPLDHFLGHLFSDLLSTRRFQPQPDIRAAAVCDWLVNAARRFHRAAAALGMDDPHREGQEFIASIRDGLVTAIPAPELTASQAGEALSDTPVIVATVYAYLLSGPAVQYQVWLEAGATGWWEIPRQPLSNAFVLTPHWDPTRQWTEADSFAVRNELLAGLVRGLCSRCSKGIVLASSELDRRGERQDGPLWRALAPLQSLWKPRAAFDSAPAVW